MRARSGLYLVLPTLIFAGCASHQAVDAQTAARQQLDDRVAKLEADQAAQAALLNQLGPISAQLKDQQSALSALTGKVDNQAAVLTALSGKVDTESSVLSALSGKVDNQGATLSALSDKTDNQGAALTALSGKVDNQGATVSALSDKADNQGAALSALAGKLGNQTTALAQVKETADDAVKIARDSRMVSGKIIDSLLLTDDMVLYNYEQPELTAKGKAALDELIKRAKPQLPYIFIEIIGYSDDLSLGSQNRRIALERAESVRRYLFEVGDIPLHRMSVISYGDLKPLASNESLEGRSRNRRVTVQVLK
ncbi:MAG: OmpA family protein [Thiobacillaceae bacterium]